MKQNRDRKTTSRGSGAQENLTAHTSNFDANTLTGSGKPLSEAARQAMPWLLTPDERRARFAELMRMNRIRARDE